MFKNNIKFAFRNIIRHKGFSILNIVGLSIGLSCSILIMLFVQYELSFDRYHESTKNIHRIIMWCKGDSYQGSEWYTNTPGALKSSVKESISGIKNSARVLRRAGIINNDNDPIFENDIFYVDPEFLEIFSFPLISGNKKTALNEPFSILISEEMALRYFKEMDPVGKTLKISNNDYLITGLIKNVPENSHFVFDFLVSLNTLYILDGGRENIEHWNWYGDWNTYILLENDANSEDVGKNITEFCRKFKTDKPDDEYHLQALKDIHLSGNINFEIEQNSDIKNIYILSAVAFLIILIACLNFMNLSTAISSKRAREVGIRKVLGSKKYQLLWQFISVSIILVMISLIISLTFVELLRPVFNKLIKEELVINYLEPDFIIGIFTIVLFTIMISGIYPAFIISSFKPLNIIKGNILSDKKKSYGFRNILVVIQFSITVILIICSLTFFRQLKYIQNRDLGFTIDNILYGRSNITLRSNYQLFKDELGKNSNIIDVYALGDIPNTITMGSQANWEGKQAEDRLSCQYAPVDNNFIDFFNIKIIEGRNFSIDLKTDINNSCILNEAAVKAIGWDNPIGKSFGIAWYNNPPRKVIGIIKDFHYNSLYMEVEPLALFLRTTNNDRPYFAVKLKPENISNTIKFIEKIYKEFSPDYPFRYNFLNEDINSKYKSEQLLSDIIKYFTFIAIFLSCIGLLGLVTYLVEQKTKEIGTRKVLGASPAIIIILLTKQFIILILISCFFAIPITYFVMLKWLQNFAFHIQLSIDIFVISVLIAIIIALFTVCFQTIKAANKNPVDILRNE